MNGLLRSRLHRNEIHNPVRTRTFPLSPDGLHRLFLAAFVILTLLQGSAEISRLRGEEPDREDPRPEAKMGESEHRPDGAAESARSAEAELQSDAFPEITAIIPRSALPGEIKGDSLRFSVLEGDAASPHAGKIRSVALPEPAPRPTGQGRLYSIVIDATKSVPMSDFRRSVSSASNLMDGMPSGSKTAIFRINGKPTQVHDFDDDSDTAARSLRRIKREGKITRIYDSLFFALRETAAEARRSHRPVGGLILFTDGRDEGSYLTEEDCIEIAAKGQDLEIPIFVVLNGAAKNERLFKRMALRSGGELFRGRVEFAQLVRSSSRGDADAPVRAEPARTAGPAGLKIAYASTMPFWKAMPGQKVSVQILYDRNVIGTASYEVPGLGAFIGAHPVLTALLALLLAAILGFLGWLLLRSMRMKTRTLPTPEGSDQKLNIPEADSGVFVDTRDPRNNPPITPGRHIETEAIPPGAEMDPTTLDPSVRKRYETDAVTLNMKEKAYVVLQMALKEAPSYNLGVLVKKERDMNRLDQRYDLFLEETYLGNSSGATLAVKDIALAGIHAKIKRFEKKHILFDLGGAAGTFLNGKKVLRPMPLRDGDEIRMGHTLFLFRGEK